MVILHSRSGSLAGYYVLSWNDAAVEIRCPGRYHRTYPSAFGNRASFEPSGGGSRWNQWRSEVKCSAPTRRPTGFDREAGDCTGGP